VLRLVSAISRSYWSIRCDLYVSDGYVDSLFMILLHRTLVASALKVVAVGDRHATAMAINSLYCCFCDLRKLKKQSNYFSQ
jgi:hypothetical protein